MSLRATPMKAYAWADPAITEQFPDPARQLEDPRYVISVEWTWPTQDYWSHFSLVRSPRSPAVRREEGQVLMETTRDAWSHYTTDRDEDRELSQNEIIVAGSLPRGSPVFRDPQPPPGEWVYYSAFCLSANRVWSYAGSVSAVGVADYNWTLNLPELLPGAAISEAQRTISPAQHGEDIVQFLQNPASFLDRVTTMAEVAQFFWDPLRCPPHMLRHLMFSIGYPFDDVPGIGRIREVVAALMGPMQGSMRSIDAFVRAATGCAANVDLSHNLMLSAIDSSFEDGTVGNWESLPSDSAKHVAVEDYDAPTWEIYREDGTPTDASALARTSHSGLDEDALEDVFFLDGPSTDTDEYLMGMEFSVTVDGATFDEFRLIAPTAETREWRLWDMEAGPAAVVASGTIDTVEDDWASVVLGTPFDLIKDRRYMIVWEKPSGVGYYVAPTFHAESITSGPLVIPGPSLNNAYRAAVSGDIDWYVPDVVDNDSNYGANIVVSVSPTLNLRYGDLTIDDEDRGIDNTDGKWSSIVVWPQAFRDAVAALNVDDIRWIRITFDNAYSNLTPGASQMQINLSPVTAVPASLAGNDVDGDGGFEINHVPNAGWATAYLPPSLFSTFHSGSSSLIFTSATSLAQGYGEVRVGETGPNVRIEVAAPGGAFLEIRSYEAWLDPTPVLPPNVLFTHFLHIDEAGTIFCGRDDPVNKGIPIHDWTKVRMGCYAHDEADPENDVTIQMGLEFYDHQGAFLGSDVILPERTLTSLWAWHGNAYDDTVAIDATFTSQNAAYAVPWVTVSDACSVDLIVVDDG